jgi:dTDP-4-amino-4,6-dideoxygalactose transaminase
MSNDPIPFGRPMLDASEIAAVTEVLSGPQLVHGPVSHEFEQRFAERMGARHAVSVSSCTAGLHLSLLVKGVGPGDRVAVPATTHVATAHAVEYCGAQPRFVDVEADSGNIDATALSEALEPEVKAIMVVHYLGLPCDMDPILALAETAGAFVIEDCALAVDATYGEAKAGTLGLTGCFSFYPVKHMTTLEGGMVTSNDEDVAAAIAQRKAFGYDRTIRERAKPGIYDVTALGYNYRMNEAQAAIGLSQLGKLDAFQKARAENHRLLKSALAELDEVTVFEPVKGKATSSHYCLNAVLPRDGAIERDAVVASLREAGIGTSVHYPRAVPLLRYYRDKYGYREGQFPVSEWLADQTISLPVGPHLKDGDALRIAEALKRALRQAGA